MIILSLEKNNITEIDSIFTPIKELIKAVGVYPQLHKNGLIDYHDLKNTILYFRSLCEKRRQKLGVSYSFIDRLNIAFERFDVTGVDLVDSFEKLNKIKEVDMSKNSRNYQSWLEILYYHYFSNQTQEEVAALLEIGRATIQRRKVKAEFELFLIVNSLTLDY